MLVLMDYAHIPRPHSADAGTLAGTRMIGYAFAAKDATVHVNTRGARDLLNNDLLPLTQELLAQML